MELFFFTFLTLVLILRSSKVETAVVAAARRLALPIVAMYLKMEFLVLRGQKPQSVAHNLQKPAPSLPRKSDVLSTK